MQVGLSATRESQTSSASKEHNAFPGLAQGGDIVAIAGVGELNIGDTISLPEVTETFEPIEVDEPTVSMVFQVNDGPMAGRVAESSSPAVTSKTDLSVKHIPTRVSARARESPDQFRVMARGELQLSVVIEGMRRELYEFCVRTLRSLHAR